VSLTDDQHRLVFSRLGSRLRVAGTAEFTGYDTSLNAARCEALLARAFTLFPRAGRRQGAEFWAGLRPATPSNVPLIGKSRYRNLFVNTGHGTLAGPWLRFREAHGRSRLRPLARDRRSGLRPVGSALGHSLT